MNNEQSKGANEQGEVEIENELELEKVSGGGTTLIARADLVKTIGKLALQSGHDNPDTRIPTISRFIR